MNRVLLGVYYGFPLCCIHQFVNGELTHRLPEWQGRTLPLDGSGFVPCVKCAVEKTEEQLIEEITRNRLSPIPFPDDDSGTWKTVDLATIEQKLKERLDRAELPS